MKTSFLLKNKSIWLTSEILLILVEYKDSRCYSTPNRKHLCFWEGDFECVLDVIKFVDSNNYKFLAQITLNDHDQKDYSIDQTKKGKWVNINVPDNKGDYILSLSGGPGYASGYKIQNDLSFEISWRIQK